MMVKLAAKQQYPRGSKHNGPEIGTGHHQPLTLLEKEPKRATGTSKNCPNTTQIRAWQQTHPPCDS